MWYLDLQIRMPGGVKYDVGDVGMLGLWIIKMTMPMLAFPIFAFLAGDV